MRKTLLGLGLLCLSPLICPCHAQEPVEVALIVAVDVSGSVNEERYHLQMEGIAEALRDPEVLAAITDGSPGGILFQMVAWADTPKVVVDWRHISSKEDADATAATVRQLPVQIGNFTCMGKMLRTLSDVTLPMMPTLARRVVIDISGDGIDNCTPPANLADERKTILATGATINGLPILVPGENDTVNVGAFRAPGFGFPDMSKDPGHEQTTLDRWYHDFIIGGPGAFVLAAKGYGDFKRALRHKFVIEIGDARRHVHDAAVATR